jgi:hypothetical protein
LGLASVRPAAAAASAGDVNTCAGTGIGQHLDLRSDQRLDVEAALAQLLEPVDVDRYGGDVDDAEEVEKCLRRCARRWERGNGDQAAGRQWLGTARRRVEMAIYQCSTPNVTRWTLSRQVLFVGPAKADATYCYVRGVRFSRTYIAYS